MKAKLKFDFYRSLLVSLFLFSVSTSHAGLLTNGFSASYEVYHKGIYLGTTVRHLKKQDEKTWDYRSHTAPEGIVKLFVSDIIDESSTIKFSNNQLQPVTYKYHQHGGKKEKIFQLDFDWGAKQLSNSNTRKNYPIENGAHDLLSFQLQLMYDLQAGKKTVSYVIADKKRVDTYSLNFEKTEDVETPMRTFSAIKLVSNKIRDKMQFIIWCAPKLNYLPIKVMKIEEDGDESVLSLKSISIK